MLTLKEILNVEKMRKAIMEGDKVRVVRCMCGHRREEHDEKAAIGEKASAYQVGCQGTPPAGQVACECRGFKAGAVPLGNPGVTLTEEGWVRDPKPGLHWVRRFNEAGTRMEPVLAVVTPCGPSPDYACWADTPNIQLGEHESAINFFVDHREPYEYLPYTGNVVIHGENGQLAHALVSFEIITSHERAQLEARINELENMLAEANLEQRR